MKLSYILLAILWGVYFSLHSMLARSRVKEQLRQRAPAVAKHYRLLYNLLAIGGLAGIFYFSLQISEGRWFPPVTGIRFVSLALASWGVIIIRLCFKQYSVKEFLLGRAADKRERLKTDGLLRYVRHPMYAGLLLVLIGFWLYVPTTANLITVVLAAVYILIGIQLEERSLIRRYGEEYLKYKKRVPMLVPSVIKFAS